MPTIFENLRRTAYQRPYMQSYKDPFSSRNDNTNWRGWTEPGRWGAQRSSMLSLDQFPGQSAAERVAPRNAFNQLNPLSGSGPFQSTYTPGVGYKSFEEALAVGKEARTKQDMEDYERYAAALGISVTAEGFAQYSKEKGAERGLETSTAQKNAEIARDQANKNREYVLDVLTADSASRAQFRAQQISAQKETNRQDRWQQGGSYGSYGSSGTSRRGGTRTNNTATQAITAVGSGAFNDANERQVANYLIKAGVNQYQFDTGMANWSNKRRTFGRGEYKFNTGFDTPAEKAAAAAIQQEADIDDMLVRADVTGLKDFPVDEVSPERQKVIESGILERRHSALTNKKAYQDTLETWADMVMFTIKEYNEGMPPDDKVDIPNKEDDPEGYAQLRAEVVAGELPSGFETAVSNSTKREKWLTDFINDNDWIQGRWSDPTFTPPIDAVGEDLLYPSGYGKDDEGEELEGQPIPGTGLDAINPFMKDWRNTKPGSQFDPSDPLTYSDTSGPLYKGFTPQEMAMVSTPPRAKWQDEYERLIQKSQIDDREWLKAGIPIKEWPQPVRASRDRRGAAWAEEQHAFREANMTGEELFARDERRAAEAERGAGAATSRAKRERDEDLFQAGYRLANPDNPSVVRQYAADEGNWYQPGLEERDRALVDERREQDRALWDEEWTRRGERVNDINARGIESAAELAAVAQAELGGASMGLDGNPGGYIKAKEAAIQALQYDPNNQDARDVLEAIEDMHSKSGAERYGPSSADPGPFGWATPPGPLTPDTQWVVPTEEALLPEPEVVQQPPPSPLQFDLVKEAQIFLAEAEEFLKNRDWESAGQQAEEALRLDPSNERAAMIIRTVDVLKKNLPLNQPVGTPPVTPLLPKQPATPLTAPPPQHPGFTEDETGLYNRVITPPDDYIPYEVGKNVWFGDPSPGRLTPAWGSQVVGPNLKSPNWEMFKTNLGSVATAPFESAKGLTYGVNKWIANPLTSLFSDYRFPTEDIFQERSEPIMNPTAYTKDGRKPKVTTKFLMDNLWSDVEESVIARLRAEGKSRFEDDPSYITQEVLAQLRSEFDVVDMDELYRVLGIPVEGYQETVDPGIFPRGQLRFSGSDDYNRYTRQRDLRYNE